MYVFKDGSPGVVETSGIGWRYGKVQNVGKRKKCQMKQDSKFMGEGDVGGNTSFPYLISFLVFLLITVTFLGHFYLQGRRATFW